LVGSGCQDRPTPGKIFLHHLKAINSAEASVLCWFLALGCCFVTYARYFLLVLDKIPYQEITSLP
ncbi:hypothetical protein, partial [Serratia marcescens]|uniref:hypothetical protein n=1 Tax=Serratia marcescens TaxID=615 RepID=UPI00235FCAEF